MSRRWKIKEKNQRKNRFFVYRAFMGQCAEERFFVTIYTPPVTVHSVSSNVCAIVFILKAGLIKVIITEKAKQWLVNSNQKAAMFGIWR